MENTNTAIIGTAYSIAHLRLLYYMHLDKPVFDWRDRMYDFDSEKSVNCSPIVNSINDEERCR